MLRYPCEYLTFEQSHNEIIPYSLSVSIRSVARMTQIQYYKLCANILVYNYFYYYVDIYYHDYNAKSFIFTIYIYI